MVSQVLDPSLPIKWESSHLGNSSFYPKVIYQNPSKIPASEKFHVVIMSVPNLQSFQTYCSEIESFLHSQSVIVVECTGFVHLEPFVLLSLPKFKTFPVCSIMNESDIKRHPRSNTFSHRVLGNDHRIYFGTSTEETKALVPLRNCEPFLSFYKALQTMQEHLKGSIGLLKSINAREFVTYQWKLALPRIVLNPLSVVFEEAYPANLEKQILVKPLISGLIHELFKIIKKMECKLVKGFENEANILKNWLEIYPVNNSKTSPAHSDSNLTFYNFYHLQDIDVDLLLLQPILLGDDHGVKTPYLENLYSMLCQFVKINSPKGSIFFYRKFGTDNQDPRGLTIITQDLSKLKLEKDSLDREYAGTKSALRAASQELVENSQKNDNLSKSLQEMRIQHDAKMKEFSFLELEKEKLLATLDDQINDKMARIKSLTEQAVRQSTLQSNAVTEPDGPVKPNTSAEASDFSEYAAFAVYGAQINNERISPNSRDLSGSSSENQRSSGNGMDAVDYHDANMSHTSTAPLNLSSMDAEHYGNGGIGNDPNRKYRQTYSNNNMYGGHYDQPYDQRNESNGYYGPVNQRIMPMYPQNGAYNQSRAASFNNQYQQNMGPQNIGPQNMGHPGSYRPNSLPLHPIPGSFPYYSGNGGPGQNFVQKKQGRRSTFADPALNIDYGGRGGMPMPSTGAKLRPGIGGHPAGQGMSQRKSISGPSTLGGQINPENQAQMRYKNTYGGYK